MSITKKRKNEIVELLKRIINPLDVIFAKKTKHYASGNRRFEVYHFRGTGREIQVDYLTPMIADLCGYSKGENGLLVTGSGFSAEQEMAETLSMELFGENNRLGYATL